MRLESARGLKLSLVQGVIVPLSVEGAAIGPLPVGARPVGQVPRLHRSIALGIARQGGNYRLAVRVQRPGLLAGPLVEHIVREARGEADVRLIGRIDKRGGRRASRSAPAAAGPWYRGKVRPLVIGASVGHATVTAGTIGGFVHRGGRVHLLSNNHVLADEDRAKVGDAILQPGSYDGGRRDDRVATLAQWVRLKTGAPNLVDAAIARLDASVQCEPTRMRELVGGADRRLAGLGPEFLDEGTTVYKIGRTTGPTEGRVTAFDVDNVVVRYDSGNLRFDNQIEIEGSGRRAFSDGGDSGSLIVSESVAAVALLFAGSDTGGANGLGLTYANSIHEALKAVKAELAI
jgi:hypothetical protein